MTPQPRRSRLTDKDQVALGAAVVAALAGVLIWLLWVIPVSASVSQAQPSPLGEPLVLTLGEGERAGIWASGISPALGTMECAVRGPEDADLPVRAAPSLGWDDTLWWMTPRRGFAQVGQVTASDPGIHEVRCTDSLDTYDGFFLVAGDSFGGGEIGLGRSGSAGFAVGSVLAFCAVVLPLFALLLPIVIGLRLLLSRRPAGER